jgi:hypothetical protein
MHRIIWFVDAPGIVRAEGFQDTLRRSPSAPIEESCANTRIDPEEGNITHGFNATPRAWTSFVSQFIA